MLETQERKMKERGHKVYDSGKHQPKDESKDSKEKKGQDVKAS